MSSNATDRIPTARLYAAAIAIVSGSYSILAATGAVGSGRMDGMMGASGGIGLGGWVMLVLGLVVLVHGVVLLTPLASRLGAASGPLMVGYAVLMLLNQVLAATVWTGDGSGMGGPMSGSMGGSMAAGWDGGMVALAALMLFSGLVMTTRDDRGM